MECANAPNSRIRAVHATQVRRVKHMTDTRPILIDTLDRLSRGHVPVPQWTVRFMVFRL